MPEFSSIRLYELLARLNRFLAREKAKSFGLIRCRTGSDCGDIFAYVVGFDRGSTKPMFMKNWNPPIGYSTIVEPAFAEVYGWPLCCYVPRAFKGFDLEKDHQIWLMPFDEQIKPFVRDACQLLDECGLDRLYFVTYESEAKLGNGFVYCTRKLNGKPCQLPRQFAGHVVYQVGIASVDEEQTFCPSSWSESHLRSLDEAIKLAGLSPNAGHAGGKAATKTPFRCAIQRAIRGVSSLKHC